VAEVSITVSVGFIAPWDKVRVQVELDEGATLRDAMLKFQSSLTEIVTDDTLKLIVDMKPDEFVRSNTIMVNGKHVRSEDSALGALVCDGDAILLIPPILGG
jgi:molybdopterin converting factor small subunit